MGMANRLATIGYNLPSPIAKSSGLISTTYCDYRNNGYALNRVQKVLTKLKEIFLMKTGQGELASTPVCSRKHSLSNTVHISCDGHSS